MIGIDISPTACRVMAKHLRNVCGLPESEPLRKAGRGFIVRDLSRTEEKLRAIPPFEFENWAVIALGGIPNKTKVGDFGKKNSAQLFYSPSRNCSTATSRKSWCEFKP